MEIGEAVATPQVEQNDKDKKGALKICIVNACDGQPIKDVTINIRAKSFVAAAGELEVNDLPVGSLFVRAYRHFAEADYITFIAHYPKITLSHKARSERNTNAEVKDGATEQVTIELDVFRLVEKVVFHRKHISPKGEDKYGHWWTKIDDNESYGWWPKYPMSDPRNAGAPAPEPPVPLEEGAGVTAWMQHSVDTVVHAVRSKLYQFRESSLMRTFVGVEGELNGVTSFRGRSTRDPHHADKSAEEEYQPVLNDCRADTAVKECLREFAQSYAKNYGEKWSWFVEFGNHCHTMQKRMISHCELTQFKPLK
jgi:hypothetical protein